MKTLLKWVLRGFAAVAGIVLVAVAGLWGVSQATVMRSWPKTAQTTIAAHDAGAVARGQTLAMRYGCLDCHGAHLTGKLFFDEMPVGRVWGPNLTFAAQHQSDADLARAIRTGVASDGRALWIMPSSAFAHFTDAETADILAFIRAQPVAGEHQPRPQFGPLGRVGVVLGKFRSAPQLVELERGLRPDDLGGAHAEGRSLARACMECHGADLKGGETTGAPDLTVAAAYDFEDFARLLRTGVAAGDRKLGLMSEAAPGRFASLSDRQIAELHDYLKARAGMGN